MLTVRRKAADLLNILNKSDENKVKQSKDDIISDPTKTNLNLLISKLKNLRNSIPTCSKNSYPISYVVFICICI